jgi:hypothetical protein
MFGGNGLTTHTNVSFLINFKQIIHPTATNRLGNQHPFKAVVPNVGGTAPWGVVGLPRWALIGTRGGRERCYVHRGALVEK